ncbi:ABC transporter C family member 10 [Spatholobus suberectus]|nr:ABC transporter C family member 10 [Spatholobus suberectus]
MNNNKPFKYSLLEENDIVLTGNLVEYDEPMSLMKIEGSLFRQLVNEYYSHFQSVESH